MKKSDVRDDGGTTTPALWSLPAWDGASSPNRRLDTIYWHLSSDQFSDVGERPTALTCSQTSGFDARFEKRMHRNLAGFV